MRKTAGPTLFLLRNKAKIGCLVFGLGLTSCISAPPPYEDYTLARTAVTAAKDVDSARFARGLWQRAQNHYRQGKQAYQQRDFDMARNQFRLAIKYAERAENVTRLKKFETGDTFQ